MTRPKLIALAAMAAMLPAAPALAADPAANADAAKPEAEAAKAETSKSDDITVIEHKADNEKVFTFDHGVPSSPALTLLGIDQNKVTQSNSLKPFVLALPGLATGGLSGQAIALDISPAAYLVRREDQSYLAYKGSSPSQRLRRIAFRTRLGTALYGGVDDSDPTKQAASRVTLGMSSSLLDTSDPLVAALPGSKTGQSAWETCFRSGWPVIEADLLAAPVSQQLQRLKQALNALQSRVIDLRAKQQASGLTPAEETELTEKAAALPKAAKAVDDAEAAETEKTREDSAASKVIPACNAAADLAARLGPDLDIGGGVAWEGDPGKLKNLELKATVLWVSGRIALGNYAPPKAEDGSAGDWQTLQKWVDDLNQWFMLGATGRFGWNESVSTGDKTTPQVAADTINLWGGLERYTKASRISAQLGWEKVSPRAASAASFDGSRMRWHLAWDQRLSEKLGLWTTLSYGHANATGGLKSDSEVRLSFTFSEPKAQNTLGQ